MVPALPRLPSDATNLRRLPEPPGAGAAPGILVLRPTGLEDAQQAIEAVRSGRSVILNASRLEPVLGQRVVDFTCGGITALDGQSHRLGEAVFLFAPALARIEGHEEPGL